MRDLSTKIANVRVHGYIPWYYTTPQAINNLPPGSMARLIGGVQASVAPKVGSTVMLQPSPTSDGKPVTVTGNVTPVTAAQAVRVDMMLENGQRATLLVLTNTDGSFTASFSLPASETPSTVTGCVPGAYYQCNGLGPGGCKYRALYGEGGAETA